MILNIVFEVYVTLYGLTELGYSRLQVLEIRVESHSPAAV